MKNILLILLLLTGLSGFAQDSIPAGQNSPKVGLVLSGGGAKGLAHIGALKVLDSLGVHPDYVAGTSMGAIIGSLYASGYTGKELDSIFREVNFDDIINDHLPRAAKTFYERDNSEKYAVTLPFDGLKVHFPSALSRGQNTFNLLSKLTLHVSDVEDFSQLPIPFFCIATNVETGRAVMMDHGNLPQTVLASGALPSLFQPVKIGDSLLIDGGVVNNYPIDELRTKGMDMIIGVDVQDSLATRDELKSAPEILMQINNYRTIKAMKEKSKQTDIYIKPDISDFNVVSFSEGESIVKMGEVATQLQYEKLKDLAKTQDKQHRAVLKKIKDSIVIDTIKINGNKHYTRAYIQGKLKFKSHTTVSYKRFSQGINNLVATNNFSNFYYKLKPAGEGDGYNMTIDLTESEQTTFLKLGLHYDDLYKSSALINLTKRRFITNNDVLSLDLIFGDNFRYDFEYFIDKGTYWSIGLKSRFNQFNKNIPATSVLTPDQLADTELNKVDMRLDDFTNQFYLQTLFTKDVALRLGAEHKLLKLKSETLVGEAPEDIRTFENSHYGSVFGQLKLDTYDNRYFPTKGFYFDSDAHWYLYSSDYNETFSPYFLAKGKIGYAQKLFKKFSFNLEGDAGFKIGEENTPYLNYTLGGYARNLINNFMSFYGYDFMALSGDSFIKSTLTFDYNVWKKHHLQVSANFANIGDAIFENATWPPPADYSGYALGYSVETFLGPVELKYTWSPETHDNIWFFNLGFWF